MLHSETKDQYINIVPDYDFDAKLNSNLNDE